LVASLPEAAADDTAVRDGIGIRPPPGIGPRAWLLTQLIAAAPLTGWLTRFGLDARQIVSLPVEGNLGADVHAGWRLAAVSQVDLDWAEAILAAREPDHFRDRPEAAWPPDDQLASILPPDARAERAAAMLRGTEAAPAAITEAASCTGPWPASLAEAVVATLRSMTASATWSRPHGPLMIAAARYLSADGPTDYAAALARLADAGTCPQPWAAALRRAADTLALRRAFLEEIR
jgi:hypothetical protein